MSDTHLTDAELLAFLDEMLPAERSVAIEKALRDHSELRQRAAMLAMRRDQGGYSVGEIWRRRHLSCLSRKVLGSYLLGVADPDLEDYIHFHTNVIGCRICAANLDDLRNSQQDTSQQERQRRYFESSAGLLRRQPQDDVGSFE